MILDCVLVILLSVMLVLRFGHFPFKLCYVLKNKKRKKTLVLLSALLLLSPQHLVFCLNNLRVRVYFCEIIINQYNCIWHF